MNEQNYIRDEEFISFLRNLGVETYNMSFEWLLSDPDYAGVLGWIYNNLDQNNALTSREEHRYSELEKQGKVFSSGEDLKTSLRSIQDEFKGLCLPGDQDGLEDVRLQISFQKQRLAMLNQQEEILKGLIQEKQAVNHELTVELTNLNAAEQQAAEDERSAAEECLKLAQQVEDITTNVVDTVADALNVYSSCAVDKEVGKRFFTYGPFESYKETQELYKTYVNLFTSLKFDNKLEDSTNDEARLAVSEAMDMENSLSDAIGAYIKSKAELSGVQVQKMILIDTYENGHPSQCSTKESHKSANQSLKQEKSILEQQKQSAIKQFVDRRTALTVANIYQSALVGREQLYKDLTFLLDIKIEAVALDKLLYCALRHELHSTTELLCFASHFKDYLTQEAGVIYSRIKSMIDTCINQELAEVNLQNSDVLLRGIFSVLDAEPVSDAVLPIILYKDIRRNIRETNEDILYEYRLKEAALEEIKNQAKPLYKYIWDGCTKQLSCHNRSVSTLKHQWTHEMASVEAGVMEIGDFFNTVTNGDEHNIRKLWQWFLTDPTKLLAAVRHARN